MKKVSLVVVVSLLVSMVAYGTDYWRYGYSNSIIWPASGVVRVGIGTGLPGYTLDVKGTIQMTGFRLPTGKHDGYVLTSNSSGVGTWKAAPSGGGTCYWSKSGSRVYYNFGNVGIGTNPTEKLHIYQNTNDDAISLVQNAYNGRGAYYSLWAKSNYAGLVIYDGSGTGVEWVAGEFGSDNFSIKDASNKIFQIEPEGAANTLYLKSNGSVGIGTPNPQSKLQVDFNSGTSLTGTSAFAGIHLNPSNTNDDFVGITADAPSASGEVTQAGILFQGSGAYGTKIHFLTTNLYADGMKQRMIIDHLGNVGIGTTNAGSYKLAVNGTIRAKEIIVESDWSDFVFEDDYRLMPLEKLEKHIKEEKSLPGIPKEKEVVKNGVNLGEMQAKLLEKVEELTLYVINQDKELNDLKKEVEDLKEENEKLKKDN